MQSETLIAQLQAVQKGIENFDAQLAATTAKHEDARLFASIPGAGACLVPRLIAAFGSQRELWGRAEALASWSGVAPVIKQSGKMRSVHSRHQRPRFVRQGSIELASCTLKYCPWVMAFYTERQAKGWKHNRTPRAIAYKWVRILWRMWKDRKTYAPETMQSPYNPARPTTTPTHEPTATPTSPKAPSKR